MTKLTGVKAVLADPKRLAKWKSNPGLRGKLPEKYLTPEQRLARRMGQEIFPGAGITGFEQARQAKSATDQVYGPQKLALQDQANTVAAQRQRNAGWWDQYVGQLRAMQAPAANTQAGPDVGAQYGAPAGPAIQGVQQAAGGYQQALSALAQGMLANNVASGGQRKLESLAASDAQETAVKQKQGALQKEADLFNQDQKAKIGSGARQQYLENLAYLGKNAATELAAKKLAETKRHNQAVENKPDPVRLAPDGVHTMADWLAASPSQRLAWKRQAAAGKGPKAGEPGSPQRKKQFDKGMATLSLAKTPWLDGKGRKVYTLNGKIVPEGTENAELRKRPYNAAYVRSHREEVISRLVADKGLDRGIAARVVDRYLEKNSGKSLGSGRS